MTDFLSTMAAMFGYMLLAIFVQNAVFTRALGVSRLIRLVSDSAVSTVIFCGILTLVLGLNAPLAYYANLFLSRDRFWYREYIRPLVYCVCVIAVVALILLIVNVFKMPRAKEISSVLPLASFNCAVLGPLLLGSSQNFSLIQTIGFSVGSGIGYGFAAMIVSEGQRKLSSRRVPATFRGLPINLLYIGILALAIYGLTGHRLAI